MFASIGLLTEEIEIAAMTESGTFREQQARILGSLESMSERVNDLREDIQTSKGDIAQAQQAILAMVESLRNRVEKIELSMARQEASQEARGMSRKAWLTLVYGGVSVAIATVWAFGQPIWADLVHRMFGPTHP